MINRSELLNKLLKQQEDEWKRYESLLPKSADIELIILKGHLIIEDMLKALIISFCNYPAHINSARLSFSQAYHVARALQKFPEDKFLWQAIALLNKLRNMLAHKLEPCDLEENINKIYIELFHNSKHKHDHSITSPLPQKCCYIVGFIIGKLAVCIPINAFLAHNSRLSSDDAMIIRTCMESAE